MPRQKRNPNQLSMLDNYGKTAPAVPAIREKVWEWRDSGYKGATDVSRLLLNYWFRTDHKLHNGMLFRYNTAQREALESLVYVFEVAQTRTQTDLYQRFIPAELSGKIRLPADDPYARYCIKMATGSGKTKVMSLAIAWQYFNSVAGANDDYAKTFFVFAPNVIVFERLRTDFAGGKIFKEDPIIPKELQIYWEMQFYMRGESERASSLGALYLTNIQQMYERTSDENDEPDIMTAVLGSKPPSNVGEVEDFRKRAIKRNSGRIMVLNDEAHHTHDDDLAWMKAIHLLHADHAMGVAVQLDVSATPRYTSGALFAWTISDYTLKQAITDRVVKRPVKGMTDVDEAPSQVPHIRYEPFITAGVERWREYRWQLEPLGKKPLLFLMLNTTDEADSIGEYLGKKYPDEFGGNRTLIIHTKSNGDIATKDLDLARKAAREVDSDSSPVNAIISVLMLREGWDVQNVTVVVGLRPYNAKANILPEQTIGRGLRLMFRNTNTEYVERVDIIGNKGFIKFIEELEKEEQIDLDTWQVGKEKLVITVIEPDPTKSQFDIAMPVLSPILARTTSLQREVEAIDVMQIPVNPLPMSGTTKEAQTFTYQGMDILTLERLFERKYTIPTPQTSQEIISYYAQAIAHELKLPSQFAVLAPKVRDFFRMKAYGKLIADLDTPDMLHALSTKLAQYVVIKAFTDALRDKLNQPQTPVLEKSGRALSGITPFPWSQRAPMCRKTPFNRVPCDNKFEEEFAAFLDRADDVARFSKLPMNFGFSIPYTDNAGNLRHYYPDFVAVDTSGTHYLIETKGREDTDVINKDRAATVWCDHASTLTGQQWRYVKVMQREYESLQPGTLAECAYAGMMQMSMFTN
jgi:type III restriction enzyme